MEFALSTEKINELGNFISDFLHKNGVNGCSLVIPLSKDKIDKVNEDLYYRLGLNETDEKLEEGDTIKIKFPHDCEVVMTTDSQEVILS